MLFCKLEVCGTNGSLKLKQSYCLVLIYKADMHLQMCQDALLDLVILTLHLNALPCLLQTTI